MPTTKVLHMKPPERERERPPREVPKHPVFLGRASALLHFTRVVSYYNRRCPVKVQVLMGYSFVLIWRVEFCRLLAPLTVPGAMLAPGPGIRFICQTLRTSWVSPRKPMTLAWVAWDSPLAARSPAEFLHENGMYPSVLQYRYRNEQLTAMTW